MKKWIVRTVIAVAWLGSLYLAYGFGNVADLFTPDRVSTAAVSCADDPAACGFADTEGRVEVDCDAFVGDSPDQAVLFVFGQSNSANHGKDRYVAGNEVINFSPLDGRCYQAEDPLLGADGLGGSVWGRLGDDLVREGLYRRVVADTPPDEYVAMFGALVASLAELGIDAPVFPAVATHCYFEDGMRVRYAASAERIRGAQASLPERIPNVRPGPDTDAIVGPRFRHDGCHFNYQGIDAHARLWVRALREAAPG